MSALESTAALGAGYPNLANWAARQKPGGGIAEFANLVSAKNPIIDQIPWVESNLPTGHRITQVNSLPSPSWRTLNRGVAATKGITNQFDEVCGILEDESKVDVDVAKLNGDAAAYRASEDMIKKESFAQTFATALFYESATSNPERIHGLTPRYALSTGGIASDYVLDGGAGYTNAGTNCQSVWLIAWAPRKLYGIYPKGSMAGFVVQDKGEQRVLDTDSQAFWAYVTKLQWKCGIAVEDYRYAVRMQWDPDDPAYLDDDRGMYLSMQSMINTIFEETPNMRFYMNRTSKKKLDAQLLSNENRVLEYLSPEGTGGKKLPHYMGVPIVRTDALVAETALAA